MKPAQPGGGIKEDSVIVLSRRDLIKALGGGIVVMLYSSELAQAQDKLPSSYLRIGVNGTVTLLAGKVELGQGAMTSLAQMAAEELDVPLDSMRVLMGDTLQCPTDPDGGTYGSYTTRNIGPTVRTAAARARAVLVALASQQLGMAPDQLFTRAGYVVSRADETVRISYAALAGGKNVEAQLDQTPTPKDVSQFTLCGKPVLRLDALEKVTGQAKYTGDIRLPGMLYARILRPPTRAATLKSVDTSAAEQVAGARVVRSGSLIAVLHEQPDMAERALRLIKAEYNPVASGPNEETIYQYLLGRAPSAATVGQKGNVANGEQLAALKVEQTYYTPYFAHAPMEPHAAVASVDATGLSIWASTQTPYTDRSAMDAARLIVPYVGGAFGGKIDTPQISEAVQLARAAGKPVSLAWTREEEFTYDAFQCPSIVKIRAGIDTNGKLTFWDNQVYYIDDRGAAFFYDAPNYRVRKYGIYSDARPFPGGAWRGPGNSANTFARESHIDALAAAAGLDPVEFRLKHLTDARMRNVIEQAAERFGWQTAKAPSGRGYGMACGQDSGTYVVTMAEVAVDAQTGAIVVKRVLSAQDMGRVINPDGARQQIESGIMMGLGYSLTEEIHFSNGRIKDVSFLTYQIPRFSWLPAIDTLLVANDALSPQGGGEPPVIAMGGALANAVFDATGARMNRLPMTPDRVLAAIQLSQQLKLDSPKSAGGQVQLSWKGGPGIHLQRSSSLTQPAWQDVAGTEGASNVTLQPSEASEFFRLTKP
jgi:isoquinoline 1-oxidoreductase